MLTPCDILVFGGTGDLALHKLFPALYHLHREGRLAERVTAALCELESCRACP